MWRVALLVTFMLGSAHAATYQDPDTGLQLVIGGPGAKVCFIRPAALHDATACAGQGLAHSDADVTADDRMFASVEDGDLRYAVFGTSAALAGDLPLTSRDIDELGHSSVGQQVQVDWIHGLQVIGFVLTSRDGTVIVQKIVRMPGALVGFQFIGDVPFDKLHAIADATLATVAAPALEQARPVRPELLVLALGLVVLGCGALALVALRLRRARVDDDDIELWALHQRRRAGLRIAAVGQLVFAPTLIWLLVYLNWDSTAPVTRVKVVGGVAIVIGLLLTIAGFITIVRARSRPLPTAIARDHGSPS